MRITVALIIILCLAACGTEQGSPDVNTVCRIAYTAKVHYAPQILAARQGWFTREGLRVEEVRLGMSAGIAAAEALVSGSADVAVMGDVPALICLASQRDCVLVAAYGGGERMHAIITAPGSSINTPADLRGKRLGVQFGSSTHGGVQLYLKRHGLVDLVQLVNMPQKDLVEALASGALDALAASEPTPTLALQRLVDSGELARLSGLGNDYPLMIVATRHFAEDHPEAIAAIVDGSRRAVEWINRAPEEVAAALAPITGAPEAIELAALRQLEWRVRLDQRVVDSLQATAGFLHRSGKLVQEPDVGASCLGPVTESTP